MDDFNTNVLSEARNEYSSRLLNILTPLVIEGFNSIFKEAFDLCSCAQWQQEHSLFPLDYNT